MSGERDPLAEALEALRDPSALEAVRKLAVLLRNMEESGLLDLAIAATSPGVGEKTYSALLVPGLLRAAEKADAAAEAAAALGEALEKGPPPVGITGLLDALRDPDVARGLAVLVEFLRLLGMASRSRGS